MAPGEAQLEIRLFGGLEIRCGGSPVVFPNSRKARALLAYLIVKAAPQRRDALCDLLWEVTDDPRAALRWCLSKLRPLVNDDEVERLRADRERVTFVATGARVDLYVLRQAVDRDFTSLDVHELAALAETLQAPFLAGLDLPSQLEFESWRIGQQEWARRVQSLVLRELCQRPLPDSSRRTQYIREWIAIEPDAIEAHVALIQHLEGTGRKAEAAAQTELSKRQLNESGEGRADALAWTLRTATPAPPPRVTLSDVAPDMNQTIRFCTASDGVQIAYATVGNGPPLMKTANWLNHLEYDWESPVWRHLFRRLAQHYQLIRYDERGNGLSDWNVPEITFDAFVRDFEAVVSATGLKRFPIFAMSQGCAVAIDYAARFPERVSRMILFNGFARGWRHATSRSFLVSAEAMMTLTRFGWGKNNPAFRRMFTTLYLPAGGERHYEWFDELERTTTSPENAVRLLEAFGCIDVRHQLPHVRVPTLVIHSRGDVFTPSNLGKEMAAGIAGARFVSLDSQNHLLLEGEPALEHLYSEMRAFLSEGD
ncbi:MAG TPA: alpha/beta fold hydrolase [Pseudomonadales bacterium]|jgi:pimeloyl-ACP methyl ester carboxylesterase/DNA-binding SARP family transcriptional activator|nr:alpha/beta fold hydrolase [Pseudomonadales bacterium]